MKLGHGYIRSYLYKIKRSKLDTCRYGKTETVEHLLLACPEGNTARKKLQKDLEGAPLTLNILLHTNIRIEKTLEFLLATCFATRKWHLERGGGGEEEEEEEEEEVRGEEA